MAGYLKTALLLIALALAGCAAGPTQEQSLNEQGQQAMEAGNMQEAERLLTEAVKENPNDLPALANLAKLYQNTNRPDQAREFYQRVIDGQAAAVQNGQDPDEAARLVQAARDNIAQMDREEAMRQEAIRREAEAAAEQAAKNLITAPPVQPEPVPAPVSQVSGYRVQTGAFSIPANAESMRNLLVGRHAGLVKGKQVNLEKINGLIKVRVGAYATRQDAKSACRAFKRAGVNCFLVNK